MRKINNTLIAALTATALMAAAVRQSGKPADARSEKDDATANLG